MTADPMHPEQYEDDDEYDNAVISTLRYARIKSAVGVILDAIGIADRPGTTETPHRVACMLADELTRGLRITDDHIARLFTVFDEVGVDELVAVHPIPFYSLCEHHLLPFHGNACVGYIPEGGKVVGLSKVARLVRLLASAPQLQERLTNNIADTLEKHLEPKGVIVVMEAEHLCMTMRGIKSAGTLTTTSAVRGKMRDPKESARQEFLSLIGRG